MRVYSLLYALINFAILAAALFFIGRKMVGKMINDYRDKVAAGLDAAEKDLGEARKIEAAKPERDQIKQEKIEAVMEKARRDVRQNQLECEREAAAEVSGYEERVSFHYEQLQRTLNHDLAEKAAAVLIDKAAAKLKQPENIPYLEAMNHEFAAALGTYMKAALKNTLKDASEGTCIVSSEDVCAETSDGAFFAADEGDGATSLDAILTYAKAISDEDRALIDKTLKENYPGVVFNYILKEDVSLIGGLRLEVDDWVYDTSVKHNLTLMREAIKAKADTAGDYQDGLEALVKNACRRMDSYEVGRVTTIRDGIANVSGLKRLMYGEMLLFPGNRVGMAMDLLDDRCGVMLLDKASGIEEGNEVRRTGHLLEVPVGEAMIGRVVDTLGRPVDDKGPLITTAFSPLENQALGVLERQPVTVPLQTGLKAVDALIPIGRGQRELIIGDRQTGKTAIALDTIINQKNTGVICIYVAIGQKESTVAGVVRRLTETGAMNYTIVVAANASEAAPMLYLAPYTGTAIGEYFMNKGKDVLIVYDDLSKQAVAYREISLLLQRPPGREAYPGDIFYVHSRLLERSARLNEARGGGSMTALPIIETQEGDISAYIPTNVISITDGQIFLESGLFNSGVRPAVNVGLSVSRVGGAAQLGAMKQVAGRMRMELAQYRELAAFSQFGSDLDKATRDTLNRGEHMTEVLKQPQYQPMSAADQIMSLYAAGQGITDDLPLQTIADFEKGLITHIHETMPELFAAIESGRKLDEAHLDTLKVQMETYAAVFKDEHQMG